MDIHIFETEVYIKYHNYITTPPRHNHFTPFFRDHPGEPVPEENFWTL